MVVYDYLIGTAELIGILEWAGGRWTRSNMKDIMEENFSKMKKLVNSKVKKYKLLLRDNAHRHGPCFLL